MTYNATSRGTGRVQQQEIPSLCYKFAGHYVGPT